MLAALAQDAVMALSGPAVGFDTAEGLIPRAAGLYALYATPQGLHDVRLPDHSGPIYVGKAQSSLYGRDLRQHFTTGRTGSSTVRRTLAAVLRSELGLCGQPRNPEKPERFDKYGLAPAGDARLTDWMRRELRIAWWVTPQDAVALADVESVAIRRLDPPLNIDGTPPGARGSLKAARALLAAEARAWRADV